MKTTTKNMVRKILHYMLSAVLALLPIAIAPMASQAVSRNISFGAAYADSLSSSSDLNIYYFTADYSGTVTIQFETSTETRTSSWEVVIVRESDLKIYLEQEFGTGPASSASSQTRVEYSATVQIPAGNYYVRVSVPQGVSLVTNQYKISVGFYAGSGSGDSAGNSTVSSPNDTIQNAIAVNLNTTVSSNLKSASDVNYFKITIPYYGSLNLSFSVGSAIDSGNWVILLYDKNEKQLQMDRVGAGGQVINMVRTNKSDKLRLPPGEYYIKVAAYSPAVHSIANYTIFADYTPERSSGYEKEFNDTPETATNILLNAGITGNLGNPDDRDYFSFSVSEHRDIKIEFISPDSITSDMWTIYLQNSKGGVATYYAGSSGSAANGFRTFATEEMILDPGLYHIVIYRYENAYSNADYTLLVRSDSAPVPNIPDDEYIYVHPTDVPEFAYNVNMELSGQIKSSGDFNNFDFGLNYSGSITVDFISPSSVTKQSWILNIFDKNNKLLYSGKYGNEGDFNYQTGILKKTSDKIRLPAGSYFAQVLPINAYDYSTVSYKIRINYAPEAKEAILSDMELFEKEYNNSAYSANVLSSGVAMTANLSDYEDVDYFEFTLLQNANVNISISTPKSVKQNNWVVEVFKNEFESPESVYMEYFGADGEPESQNSEFKISLSKNMRLSPGTYHIKVSAYNVINYSNGDYKITAIFEDGNDNHSLYESEPNNTPELANFLNFNTDITGDISSIDDVDYFKIYAGEEMEIQIKFTVSAKVNSDFWAIKLYDRYYRELKSYKLGEGGVPLPDNMKYFKTERISLSPGDYYVSIQPYNKTAFSNEEYTIKVLDAAGQKVDLYTYPADKPSDWATFEVEYAYGYGLVPDNYMRNFQASIKREEFCMLAVRFLEVAEKMPIAEILAEKDKTIERGAFSDTDDLYILSAYALGIVSGRGNGIFDPEGNITREEAATMLTRVGIFENINVNSEPLYFNDEHGFNSWSSGAIKYVSGCVDIRGNRIMNGYTDGGFHPRDTYSREQAFMTIFRLYAIKMGK
ncbi:MAG: S-layer homology domain-containing protein [Oscillospiraceae bacterium]|nr:S-layer homology domain-containing protein [Oscillospiraceae bacterium]